ncbi:MAG: hypothetical protein J7J05_09310 [Thermococcus sp.]|uniref:hypothetical protein n=1 Tax=Thermococcus sp. TaxID=35749 RepID=UPI00261C50F7|nr:hypothetical protein [Thermococcus sp.]MCD6141085.1 hypothetical protein [Thermococcus sp.]
MARGPVAQFGMSAALARPLYFEKEDFKEAQLEIEPTTEDIFSESFEHPKKPKQPLLNSYLNISKSFICRLVVPFLGCMFY